MSISELADEEILRTDRQGLKLMSIVDRYFNPVIANLQLPDVTATNLRRHVMLPLARESPIQKTATSGALDGLVKYIPTESITLYVAATSAMPSLAATFPWLTPYKLYLGFVVLTPIFVLLILIGKRRSQDLRFLPKGLTKWPWWILFASTIAFGVWALAVPPLVSTDAGKVVAAFGALLVSTLLGAVGNAVAPTEPAASPNP
jgi:hypothetical protein